MCLVSKIFKTPLRFLKTRAVFLFGILNLKYEQLNREQFMPKEAKTPYPIDYLVFYNDKQMHPNQVSYPRWNLSGNFIRRLLKKAFCFS